MKIAVLIASRNRPMRLGIALRRLAATADNPDDIHVAVWLDDDDQSNSADVVNAFTGCRVTLIQGPRPSSLGEAHNALARAIQADFYTVLADDVYPAERGWDNRLRLIHEQYAEPIYCWKHRSSDPAYPILTKRWLDAAGGVFTADLFPYWFDDFWLGEVAEIAMGKPMLCLNPLKLTGDKGTGTPRMRELRWWYGVFHSTRFLRIAEAKAIHRALYQTDMPDRSAVIADMAKSDVRRDESADRWESEYSTATGEPDAGYLAARAKAETIAMLCRQPNLC